MRTATPTAITGRHLIAGRWLAPTGRDFESRSPANRHEIIGVFPEAGAEEANQAVAAARAAYPEWRRTSRIHRAELFDHLAQLVKRDTDALAELMARECGKVLTECRAEVIEGLHMIQYVFGTGRQPIGEVLASEIADKDVSMRRKPWGVALVITPWNFPFAVPLWMLAPSLVEGNTAIFKPSEDTPAIGQHLVELFEEAGFPPGVVNLVHGKAETGEALVRNPGVNVVLFTGSYDVGHRIQQLSADHFDRLVAAEMGSKSAVIVCDDARLDLAVSCGIISAFKTSGQRCVSAGRILVAESLFERYAEQFVATARRLRIGDPLDARNFTGPVIHEGAVEKIEHYNDLARREGGSVLLEGSCLSDPEHRDGCYLSPFVYRMNHRSDARSLREEVFGPHLALIPFRTLEDAARIYNDTDYGLSMAVITEDFRKMRYLREECSYGMGYVNLPCIGAEVHLPFGGVKKSGNGHPSAAGLVEAVTHKTAWTVNYAQQVKMAQGLTTDIAGESAMMWQFDHCKVPTISTPLPGPRARALLERDHRYMSPSYTRAYPLVCARGSGAVIEDVDGNLFLDFTAGIAVTSTGHCHPEVVQAIQDQAARLIHMSGTDFYYQPQIDLAQRLAELAPGQAPKRVFFTNSGAEALEAALKLARWHTGRSHAIAFLGAFHGRTYGAMSLSGSKLVHRRGFSPLVPDIHHVHYPRGAEARNDPHAGRRFVDQIEESVLKRTAPPEEVAAVFVEPIQGESGYHVPPPDFLPALRDLCDRHGFLLIADEVQCGMGRTGKLFAVEHWGVEPDVICLAKGIASGMPLGAIVAREDVMDWPSGSHASTFGGNPVSCRAALATLDLLQRDYLANAAARGEQLKQRLLELQRQGSHLGDIRGLGLMVAMDVVRDRDRLTPDPSMRDEVVQQAFQQGLLLLGCGESAIRFCPPLCVSAAQVDTAVAILAGVLAGFEPARVAI